MLSKEKQKKWGGPTLNSLAGNKWLMELTLKFQLTDVVSHSSEVPTSGENS